MAICAGTIGVSRVSQQWVSAPPAGRVRRERI
jgi:hypothetical protein